MKVSLTDLALTDLQEIGCFYDKQLVPHVGQRYVAEIIERIETLINHPDIGRVVPEFSDNKIRELIHPPYRVVYLREASSIFVLRVWRTERILELP